MRTRALCDYVNSFGRWQQECEEQVHRREELHTLTTVGELRREKEPVGMPGAADGLDKELVLEFVFG